MSTNNPPDVRFDSAAFISAVDVIRREAGKSWRQVAGESGVSASTLTRINQGSDPSVQTMARLAFWTDEANEGLVPWATPNDCIVVDGIEREFEL